MKNLHLTFCALLFVGMANAQFFQRVYGAPNTNEVLETGTNYNGGISISQKGFLMAGYTPQGSTSGINSVMVTRTDLSGTPVFNNRVALLSQFTQQQLSAKAKKVISLANGQIAVFGDYNNGLSTSTGPVSNQFFLMLTDASGNPIYVRTYNIGTVPFQAEATSIIQSPSNNAVLFACGYIAGGHGNKQPVVMRIDAASGSLVWGNSYADISSGAFEWTAEDLVESPYPGQANNKVDIALVGRYVLNPGDGGQGCFSTIDAQQVFLQVPSINTAAYSPTAVSMQSRSQTIRIMVTRGLQLPDIRCRIFSMRRRFRLLLMICGRSRSIQQEEASTSLQNWIILQETGTNLVTILLNA